MLSVSSHAPTLHKQLLISFKIFINHIQMSISPSYTYIKSTSPHGKVPYYSILTAIIFLFTVIASLTVYRNSSKFSSLAWYGILETFFSVPLISIVSLGILLYLTTFSVTPYTFSYSMYSHNCLSVVLCLESVLICIPFCYILD